MMNKYLFILCLMLIHPFQVNAITINEYQYEQFGGELDDIAGSYVKVKEKLAEESKAKQYLSVGSFVHSVSLISTATWLGDDIDDKNQEWSYFLTTNFYLKDLNQPFTFMSWDYQTVAKGEGFAFWPLDLDEDSSYENNIGIYKLPKTADIVDENEIPI